MHSRAQRMRTPTRVNANTYLEVPVAHAHRVAVADGVNQLVEEAAGHILFDGAIHLQQIKQFAPVNQVHHEVQLGRRRQHLAKVHNVPVVESLEDGNLCRCQRITTAGREGTLDTQARQVKTRGAVSVTLI